MDFKDLVERVLLKKAKGYKYREKTEEYNVVGGKAQHIKTKIVTKQMHPDVAALKALLEFSDNQAEVEQMTDEELKQEKLRLLNLLKICDSAPIEEDLSE